MEHYGHITGLTDLRYRGNGWPGTFQASFGISNSSPPIAYQEAWGRLTSFRPLRCNLCPDGLGRLGDLSCGDAWHRFQDDGNPGRSIILTRTEQGSRLLERAICAGYIELSKATSQDILTAQDNLLQRRRELWGRFLAMAITGIPVPRFEGYYLRKSWRKLPLELQSCSLLGMLRRILTRRLYRRDVMPYLSSSNKEL